MNNINLQHSLLRTGITSIAITVLVVASAGFAQQTERQNRERIKPANDRADSAELISASDGDLVLSFDGQQRTQKLAADTKIMLNGKAVRASALKPGDVITFSTNPQSKQVVVNATRIVIDPREDVAATKTEEFKANPVFLGVMVAPSDHTGVFVPEVALNGPADRAGIRAGDVILSVNGTAVATPQGFQHVLARLEPGSKGKIVVLRDDRQIELPIEFVSHKTAGYRPDESGEYGLVEIEEPKACLGVVLIDPEPETEGLTIAQVHPDCAAAAAGLEPGDILYSINETVVKSPAAVSAMLAKMQPGDKVSLLVRRDGERQTLTTRLADRTDLFHVSADRTDETYEEDEYGDHQLMIEQHRHFAKQHQRLEELTLELLNEVKELRKEVQSLKNGQAARE